MSIEIINDGMTKCSCFRHGHDQAVAVNKKVPPPDDLVKDIDTLELWAKSTCDQEEAKTSFIIRSMV
jgi:hypothetical protein